MGLSLWQPQSFIKLVTEISVELQPLSFLLIQQEAVDVGEQFIWRHRGYETLPVHSEFVQQHHAEVESGDSEYLSAEKHHTEIWSSNGQSPVSYILNNIFLIKTWSNSYNFITQLLPALQNIFQLSVIVFWFSTSTWLVLFYDLLHLRRKYCTFHYIYGSCSYLRLSKIYYLFFAFLHFDIVTFTSVKYFFHH